MSKWSTAELKELGKFSLRNQQSVKNSNRCGCYKCLAIFDASIITVADTIEEIDGLRTVMCPECGIDSVVGDQCGFVISTEFLKAMNNYYFDGYVW
jgi:hypothetical protein